MLLAFTSAPLSSKKLTRFSSPDIAALCRGVLALSMHSDQRYVKGFLDAGGKGYVCKEDAFDELDQAIQAVYVNKTHLSKNVRA